MRGARYKLIADWITGATELYDLESDPFETVNLAAGSLAPELRAVHNALFAAIVELVATP
jgi:hypothetical protein